MLPARYVFVDRAQSFLFFLYLPTYLPACQPTFSSLRMTWILSWATMLLCQNTILQKITGCINCHSSILDFGGANRRWSTPAPFCNMPGLPCKNTVSLWSWQEAILIHIHSFRRSRPVYRKSLQEKSPRRIGDWSNLRENEGTAYARE